MFTAQEAMEKIEAAKKNGAEKPKRKYRRRRKSTRNFNRTGTAVWIGVPLHKAIKIHCFLTGQQMTDFASRWLAEGLKRDKTPQMSIPKLESLFGVPR